MNPAIHNLCTGLTQCSTSRIRTFTPVGSGYSTDWIGGWVGPTDFCVEIRGHVLLIVLGSIFNNLSLTNSVLEGAPIWFWKSTSLSKYFLHFIELYASLPLSYELVIRPFSAPKYIILFLRLPVAISSSCSLKILSPKKSQCSLLRVCGVCR